MSIERGEVYLARFPHALGTRGKRRPVVVVQADVYNQRLRHAVVVQLTTNLSDQDDPACLLVKTESPEGRAAGLSRDSLLSGYLLSLRTRSRPVSLSPQVFLERGGQSFQSPIQGGESRTHHPREDR